MAPRIVNAFLLFLALLLMPHPGPARDFPLQQAITSFLQDDPTATLNMITTGTPPEVIDRALLSLYLKNEMHPLWLEAENGRLSARARQLIGVLLDSSADGMNPDDYKTGEILTLARSQNPEDKARLDVLLTLAMARYVADMREGSADPCLLDPELFASARDREVNILAVVNSGLRAPDLEAFLRAQSPAHRAYQGLRSALARYREIFARGGWPVIPAGPAVKPGQESERIPLIARRLRLGGEYDGPPATTLYTAELVRAVQRFQRHFQLTADGIIGPRTIEAMNIPVRELMRRIILNMERWRWLPHKLDGKRIFVNIAGFELTVSRDEQPVLTMPVIVGRVYHKTPVFTGRMTYLVINPYWNLPNSIAVAEVVPKMQKDPGYLARERIRIFRGWDENAQEVDPASIDWFTIGKGIRRYRLRQDPGPDNALGRIKFMLPNRYNVYLHDTPARQLFSRTNRSFSHGCIRLSRPLDLAVNLLADNHPPRSREELEKITASGRRTVIRLDTPLPVHIIYRTVRTTPDGQVFFFPDLYDRDRPLARALFARKPLSRCLLPGRPSP